MVPSTLDFQFFLQTLRNCVPIRNMRPFGICIRDMAPPAYAMSPDFVLDPK